MWIIMKHNERKTIMRNIFPPSCQDLKGDVLGVQASHLEGRSGGSVSVLEFVFVTQKNIFQRFATLMNFLRSVHIRTDASVP